MQPLPLLWVLAIQVQAIHVQSKAFKPLRMTSAPADTQRQARVCAWMRAGLALLATLLVTPLATADDLLASGGAAQLQTCDACSSWRSAWTEDHDLGKYKLDSDVVVRGWKMMHGVYFGQTRNRTGRSGVGVMVDGGTIKYTLNHQGFTVSRSL